MQYGIAENGQARGGEGGCTTITTLTCSARACQDVIGQGVDKQRKHYTAVNSNHNHINKVHGEMHCTMCKLLQNQPYIHVAQEVLQVT